MNLRLSAQLKKSMKPVSYSELRVLPTPSDKMAPIRSDFIADMIFEYIEERKYGKIDDVFFGASDDGNEFHGFFSVGKFDCSDFKWIIGATNDNQSGGGIIRGSFELHSGISLPYVGSMMLFSKSVMVAEKKKFIPKDEIKLLVNENLDLLREYFNLEHERMALYKKKKLSQEAFSKILLDVIKYEIIAGRLVSEFLQEWEKPKFEYLKPRTLWSLFCQCAWFLNRLQAPIMIERTINLHHFFDEVAGFDKKPTKWVQTSFA